MARKPGERPWFKLWVNDWLGSTDIDAMGPAGEGAYLRLLCRAWQSDTCSLPADDDLLSSISRLGKKAWSGKAGQLIKSKFRSEGGRLYNDKLLEEFRLCDKNHADTIRAGQASAAKKKANKQLADLERPLNDSSTGVELPLWLRQASVDAALTEVANEEATAAQRQLPKTSTVVQINGNGCSTGVEFLGNDCGTTRARVDTDADIDTEKEISLPTLSRQARERELDASLAEFDPIAAWEKFWALYPRKENQQAARGVFLHLVDSASINAKVIAGLHRWLNSADWKRNIGEGQVRFIPQASRFVSDRRFDEFPAEHSEQSEGQSIFAIAAANALAKKYKNTGGKAA